MGMAGVQNRTAFLHSEGLLALKKKPGQILCIFNSHHTSEVFSIENHKIYLLPGENKNLSVTWQKLLFSHSVVSVSL